MLMKSKSSPQNEFTLDSIACFGQSTFRSLLPRIFRGIRLFAFSPTPEHPQRATLQQWSHVVGALGPGIWTTLKDTRAMDLPVFVVYCWIWRTLFWKKVDYGLWFLWFGFIFYQFELFIEVEPQHFVHKLEWEMLRSTGTSKGSRVMPCTPFTQRCKSLSWLLSYLPKSPKELSPSKVSFLAPSATLARRMSHISATAARPDPTIPGLQLDHA